MIQDTHYFSDTEHGMMMGGSSRMEMRRIRNRTLSGLESVHRMGAGGGMGPSSGMMQMQIDPHLSRPGSAGAGSRPITPSFSNDKDPGQQFVDFNPAGESEHELNSLDSIKSSCMCLCRLHQVQVRVRPRIHWNSIERDTQPPPLVWQGAENRRQITKTNS